MATAIKKKQDAQSALENWMNQQPQKNSGAYEAALDAAVEQLMGQKSFGSSYTAGMDPNALAYRRDYAAGLKNAANASAANTQALAGGYGADYAASAAGQAAQLAAPQGYDAQQMLRQLASSGYKANAAANQAAVQALLADVGLAQNADQMNQDNWAAYRDILAGQEAAAADEELGFWGNLWNTTKRLAQAGMDIYDGVKGYQQQEFDNAMRVYEAAYGMNRDAIGDARYEQEYMDAQAAAAWNQKMQEQKFELDKQYTQTQIDAMRQDMDLAAQTAARAAAGYGGGGSSSGGGSPSLDVSDLLKIRQARTDAALMENDEDVAFYDGLLNLYGFSAGTPVQAGGSGKSLGVGLSAARDAYRYGATTNQVVEQLTMQGYTQNEIAEILNRFGVIPGE